MRFSPSGENASPRTSAAASRICGIETESMCRVIMGLRRHRSMGGVIVAMRFASAETHPTIY
jgi:hypothetical protein